MGEVSGLLRAKQVEAALGMCKGRPFLYRRIRNLIGT